MGALRYSSVATGDRSGRWLADPGFGVYVHIPFCKHRCHYCDFNTYEGRDDLHDDYVDALIADVTAWRGERRPATSVFFGGGTPTLLPPSRLARILDAVRATIGLEPGAEVTVEANPETVDETSFAQLLDAGFNRVSIGVQALVPRVLLGLGRTHSPERALEAIGAARAAGFEDVNADLIYGSPWERPEDWAASLAGVVDAAPDHVSAYALTIEEGTPLATLIATKRVPDVDPDVQADRYEVAQRVLSAAGYERYEVSNWARPGRASRHNVLYWSAGDYLGFGAGAHAHVAGRRSWSVRLPRDFIAAARSGKSTEAGHEVLADDQRAGEALMLGLRLAAGVDLIGMEDRFDPVPLRRLAATLDELVDQGLLERQGSVVRLTPAATLIANEALCRLL
jgi:putative oxygen-independent coproporphyrinogen III oxidase